MISPMDHSNLLTGYIYLHQNLINNRCYIGSSIQKSQRRWRRADKTYNSYKSCPVFYKALQKYTWENFVSIILEVDIPFDEISIREEYYIKLYDCIAPNGYNTNKIVEGRVKFSDETKKKLSDKRKEYYQNLKIPQIDVKRIEHKFINNIECKLCRDCREFIPLFNFTKDKNRWDNLDHFCKSCKKIRWAKHKENKKKASLRSP